MSDTVHIVCLDAPAPPNYGGAIDMYYTIEALSEMGRKIILHYFEYNQARGAKGLEKYCSAIHTYKRKGFLSSLSTVLPYIVSSRINQQLINRLNQDDHPVLLEGFHCAGIIALLKNKERKIVIRVHNNEAEYYGHLARTESSVLKRLYFERESKLLDHFQKKLSDTIPLACLSALDRDKLSSVYSFTATHFIPCFIPWQQINGQAGLGSYCLYHGNMAVSENEKAVEWLIHQVFASITFPLIVAGNSISPRLKNLVKKYRHISVIADPSAEQLYSLIREAQVHVLPSFNSTGVKLKLLHTLFEGRFCITNVAGAAGTGITDGLFVANDPQEYIDLVNTLSGTAFCAEERQKRAQLIQVYNNGSTASKLSALL